MRSWQPPPGAVRIKTSCSIRNRRTGSIPAETTRLIGGGVCSRVKRKLGNPEKRSSAKATLRRTFYLLTKGLVILTWDEPNGSEGVFGLRFPGEVIDLCAHGLGQPYAVSARTAGQTRICKVSLDTFNKAHDTVEAAQFFENILQVELYNAARFIVNLKTATPADRFLRFTINATPNNDLVDDKCPLCV
jgi:hypothetical protein